MEKITNFKDIAIESLTSMWFEITKVFPNIIGAIVVLLIGWLMTKVLVKIVRKALKFAKANKLDDAINDIEIIEGKKLKFDTVKIVSNFVKWLMYIILIVIASDIMNLKIISQEIGNLFAYLPRLFAALIIFILGLLFANFVKKGLKSFFESMDLSGAKIISQIVFFLLLIFISITALNQAGVNTEIITSNLTMILAAFLLAFALAFGFGAKEVVGDLLRTFYTRKTYEIGQEIEYNGKIYEVEAIDSITVVLKADQSKLVVPIKNIVESEIKIQDKP
jgi:hypothetical protein